MSLTIVLNGEPREIPKPLTLDQLVQLFSLPVQRVAVEHNGSVVRRADWDSTLIRDRDRLEVVHLVGGG